MGLERTMVLIKPDGVSRGIIGEIISRIERTGLKIVGMNMVRADDKLLDSHYTLADEWARELMVKSKSAAEREGREFPFSDHMEFGALIQGRLKDTLKEGTVIAMVVEGQHAVSMVRKLVGATEPKQAVPGTIRGDFLLDSYEIADKEKRAVRNLIHASSDVKEAEREIKLWFGELNF
jgi:nucleoside-diphosphate kinase